jgi:hypothetical protein
MLKMLACDTALCYGLDYDCNNNLTIHSGLKTIDKNKLR